MNIARTIVIIGIVILVGGGCKKTSNPVNAPFDGDFPPSSKFSITLYSSSQSAAVGQSFEVLVVLYNVTDVSGCAMVFSYPPAIVDILNASIGSSFFLPQSVMSISKNEPDSGRVSFGVAYRNSTLTQSKSGSGVVCILTCKAKSAGNCTIAINPNTLEIKTPDGTFMKNFDSLLLENFSIVIH